LAAVALLVLLFAYVWLRIEPTVGWQRHGPQFYLAGVFFQELPKGAGGLLDYSARALAQLDHGNLGGALAFAGLAGLVFLVTRRALVRLGGQVIWFAAFLPPLLLVAVRQFPGNQSFAIGLGYVLGLGLALAFDRISWTRTVLRLGACALLSAVLGVWTRPWVTWPGTPAAG
jgi:hypothetical protein